ncbi:MAG: hypothetical protein KDD94_00250, partial [Calditrichaeota bacterium]|nr:hypothetical protein [Calditrichota bacterium]
TRFYILLFICFILLIIIVAGIFAVTRINISRRIREIGIRAALGSTQLELKRLFFSEYLIISSISVCLSSTIIFLLNTFDFYRFQFTATEIVTVIIFQWSIIYLTVNKTIRTASTIRPTLALRYE